MISFQHKIGIISGKLELRPPKDQDDHHIKTKETWSSIDNDKRIALGLCYVAELTGHGNHVSFVVHPLSFFAAAVGVHCVSKSGTMGWRTRKLHRLKKNSSCQKIWRYRNTTNFPITTHTLDKEPKQEFWIRVITWRTAGNLLNFLPLVLDKQMWWIFPTTKKTTMTTNKKRQRRQIKKKYIFIVF